MQNWKLIFLIIFFSNSLYSFVIVSDIDDVLVESPMDIDNFPSFFDRERIKSEGRVIHVGFESFILRKFVAKGVVEFFQVVLKRGHKVYFFTASPREYALTVLSSIKTRTNISLLELIGGESNVYSFRDIRLLNIERFKNNSYLFRDIYPPFFPFSRDSILTASESDLKKYEAFLSIFRNTGIWKGDFKKDLIKAGFPIDETIMMDDNSGHIMPGQERNLLFLPHSGQLIKNPEHVYRNIRNRYVDNGVYYLLDDKKIPPDPFMSTPEYVASIFVKENRIPWALGRIAVLEERSKAGEPLLHANWDLQWIGEPHSPDLKYKRRSLYDRATYEKGVRLIMEVNPDYKPVKFEMKATEGICFEGLWRLHVQVRSLFY